MAMAGQRPQQQQQQQRPQGPRGGPQGGPGGGGGPPQRGDPRMNPFGGPGPRPFMTGPGGPGGGPMGGPMDGPFGNMFQNMNSTDPAIVESEVIPMIIHQVWIHYPNFVRFDSLYAYNGTMEFEQI